MKLDRHFWRSMAWIQGLAAAFVGILSVAHYYGINMIYVLLAAVWVFATVVWAKMLADTDRKEW